MGFPRLTSCYSLRHKTVRNRITFGAHTANMSVNGLPGEQYGAYLLERAVGGAGMIVCEPVPVHRTGMLTRGNFLAVDDAVIPAFRGILEPVKDAGAVVLQQLYHVGAHGDSDLSYQPHWGPSGMPSYHDSDGSHAMTEAEIEEMIAGFVAAATRCQKAGFDGVEIWAAYHSLLEQFWTPWSNQRDDQWGGSLTNRTRISMRILEGIRATCGDDFIIGMSVSQSDSYPVLHGIDELCEIVSLHDATGHMDYVSCGSGGYLDLEWLMPTFVLGEKPAVSASAALKDAINHALVQAESGIRTPENAESILSAGEADMVAIVRGQIADPHWARKVMARTSADMPIRAKLAQLGVQFLTEHAIAAWHGQRATVRNLLDGSQHDVSASSLIMATTNRSFDTVSAEIDDLSIRVIGDAQAPRQAPYAFYEGRVAGMEV